MKTLDSNIPQVSGLGRPDLLLRFFQLGLHGLHLFFRTYALPAFFVLVRSEIRRICSVLLLAVTGACSASAGTIINETFSSTLLPTSLEKTGATGNSSFDGSEALFGGFADSGRSYMRTVDKNFFSQSFTAEVTLSTGSHISFFGMGNGGNNLGASYYEPIGPSINLRLHPDGIGSGQTDAVANNGSAFTTFNQFDYPGSEINQRLRLSWDAFAKTAVFAVDYGYNGNFVADVSSVTIDGSALGLSDSNTSIFFGGSNNAKFDNFLVTTPSNSVPEAASTLALLSLGFLAFLRFHKNLSRA